MSDRVRPHRRQPTRLPRPWDSPGKNTGVGCHFLLQGMKVKSQSEIVQSCPTLSDLWTAAYQAPPSMGFSRQEYWSGLPLPSPQCIIFKDLIQVIREWFNGFRYILQFKSEFGNKEFVIWAKVSSWYFFFFFFFWLYRASPSLAANNIIDLISVFHTAHGVLKARVLKWFAIPFSSGPHSVRRLHPDPPVFGGPTHHDLVSVS